MSKKKIYRSVVIGCGGRSRMHARAYKLISRGELFACCDLDAGRRESYASSLLHRPIDIPFDPPEDLFLKLAEALR